MQARVGETPAVRGRGLFQIFEIRVAEREPEVPAVQAEEVLEHIIREFRRAHASWQANRDACRDPFSGPFSGEVDRLKVALWHQLEVLLVRLSQLLILNLRHADVNYALSCTFQGTKDHFDILPLSLFLYLLMRLHADRRP